MNMIRYGKVISDKKVGEIFNYNGEDLQVELDVRDESESKFGCNLKCHFYNEGFSECNHIVMELGGCYAFSRNDRQRTYFKKV